MENNSTELLLNEEQLNVLNTKTVSIFPQLSPDVLSQMRARNAKNLLSSYNSSYDIISELAQNAVDAIDSNYNKNYIAKGKIELTINRYEQSITIIDNGTGISENDICKIFTPELSLKQNSSLRGEKGVGLTFLLYITNHFEFETCDKDGNIISGRILNSNQWVKNPDKFEVPKIMFNNMTKRNALNYDKTYTKFSISCIEMADDEIDLFSLTDNELSYVLQTRTAFGYTGTLWDKKPNVDIEIKLITFDKYENRSEKLIPYAFPAPHLMVSNAISDEEFFNLLQKGKEPEVYGKSYYKYGTDYISKDKRQIPYYVFIARSNIFKKELQDKFGISNSDSDFIEHCFLRGKRILSTRCMPSSININHPKDNHAFVAGYYTYNFFILLDYDANLDIGRKTIPSPTHSMLTGAIERICDKIMPHIKKITIDNNINEKDKIKIQEEISDKWTDLGQINNLSEKINLKYKKEPTSEQDVICIFHELIGAGFLKNYETWHTSQKDTYDSYVMVPHFEPKKAKDGKKIPRQIEFKFLAESILDDFKKQNISSGKYYSQIHLIICWDINVEKFNNVAGFAISEIDNQPFHEEATHKLYNNNIKEAIEILSLKKFIEKINAQIKK